MKTINRRPGWAWLANLMAGTLALYTAIVVFLIFSGAVDMVGKTMPGFFMQPTGSINAATVHTLTGFKVKGMSAPTRVVEYNGRPFDPDGLSAYVRSNPPGTPIKYKVTDSPGKYREVIVPTQLFSWQDFMLSAGLSMVIALVFFVSGLVVYILKPNQAFSWAFLLFGCQMAVFNMVLIRNIHIMSLLDDIFIAPIIQWPVTGLIPVTLHLALTIFGENAFFRGRPYRYLIFYLLTGLYVFWAPGTVNPGNMAAIGGVIRRSVFLTYPLIALSFAFFIGMGVWARYQSRDPITRQRARLLLTALFIAGVSGILATVVTIWLRVVISFSYLIWPTIFLPLAIVYGALRYNLFEVDEIVKKSMLYFFILLLGGGISALVIWRSETYFRGLPFYYSPLFALLFILLSLWLFIVLKKRLQIWLDRLFARQKADFEKAYRGVRDGLSTEFGVEKIGETIKAVLTRDLSLSKAELFLADEAGNYSSVERRMVVRKEEKIVLLLKERKDIISWSELLNDPREKAVRSECLARMASIEAAFVLPAIFRDEMEAFIALGEKKSGEISVDLEDVRLMRFLSVQAAVALKNAGLYRSLEEAKREVEELNAVLAERVRQRTLEIEVRNEEIEGANEKLAAATRHKAEFLAHMSHELRTPLNGIIGFSDIILEGIYGEVPAEARQVLGELKQNGQDLLQLISDILDYSKIEAGKMELRKEDFSVRDIVDAVVGHMMVEAEKKGLKVETEIAGDLPLGWGDLKSVRQALGNFVSNAIKFTKSGKVVVRAGREEKEIVFEVEDTGIGIAPDRMRNLFGEFEQLESPLVKEYKGVGLGLALSKKLIELHGGRVIVASEVGKGSKFGFALPLKA